jgi:small GTP-binding protein
VGALLVYDITKEVSFKNVKKWMDEVKDHAEPEIVIMLVGNKLDLVQQDPSQRKVKTEDAKEFA